jgi:hypothetical protein
MRCSALGRTPRGSPLKFEALYGSATSSERQSPDRYHRWYHTTRSYSRLEAQAGYTLTKICTLVAVSCAAVTQAVTIQQTAHRSPS